jgi:hypothetical protein
MTGSLILRGPHAPPGGNLDSENENVTIKVVVNARVMVRGSQISCEDGGENQIRRQKGNKRSLSRELQPWEEEA